MFTYYGVRPIILIDEYDAPIQKGYEKGYYDDVIGFMKSLFSAAFSGDDAVVTFAVMTGTMSVPREDITSDPDGLVACAVRCDRYSRCFGFTGEDVKKITDDFGHPEKMDEIRAWYGGYKFGNTEIFNPWSVSQHVEENFTFDTYWHGSSEHAILKRLIEKATRGDVKTLR